MANKRSMSGRCCIESSRTDSFSMRNRRVSPMNWPMQRTVSPAKTIKMHRHYFVRLGLFRASKKKFVCIKYRFQYLAMDALFHSTPIGERVPCYHFAIKLIVDHEPFHIYCSAPVLLIDPQNVEKKIVIFVNCLT